LTIVFHHHFGAATRSRSCSNAAGALALREHARHGARRERALVMVHAENHDVIAWLSEKMLTTGHTAPRFHGMAHAPIAEREATSRAISLAELVDVPILIAFDPATGSAEPSKHAHN
jgi:dihydroorotase-like cyclic amidohydrolase